MAADANPRTGHGGAITFGTQGGTYLWRRITLPTQTRGSVDVSDLSIADHGNRTYLPEELADTGEGSAEVYVQNSQDILDFAIPELITITFNQEVAEVGGAATITGTGFVTGRGGAELGTGTERVATITWKFDGGASGGTDITFTAAT